MYIILDGIPPSSFSYISICQHWEVDHWPQELCIRSSVHGLTKKEAIIIWYKPKHCTQLWRVITQMAIIIIADCANEQSLTFTCFHHHQSCIKINYYYKKTNHVLSRKGTVEIAQKYYVRLAIPELRWNTIVIVSLYNGIQFDGVLISCTLIPILYNYYSYCSCWPKCGFTWILKKPSLAVKEKVGKKWVQAGFELVHTFDIAWKSPSLAARPSGQ